MNGVGKTSESTSPSSTPSRLTGVALGTGSGGASAACPHCSQAIKLQPVGKGEVGAAWACSQCGTLAYGSSGDRQASGVTSVAPWMIIQEIDPPCPQAERKGAATASARRLVQSTAGSKYSGVERRSDPRYAAAVPALAIPLSERFHVCGPAFSVTTTDVSHHGIAVAASAPLHAFAYALDFTTSGLQLFQMVVKPVRTSQRGGFCKAGAVFVSRLYVELPSLSE